MTVLKVGAIDLKTGTQYLGCELNLEYGLLHASQIVKILEKKVKYTIAAHPTIYDGVQFRSRLEARWAAFFDLSGLNWEYEPLDLKGWTPDFRIHSEWFGESLVEVKPVSSVNKWPEEVKRKIPPGEILCGDHPRTCVCRIRSQEENVADMWLPWGFIFGKTDVTERRWREAGNRTQWWPR